MVRERGVEGRRRGTENKGERREGEGKRRGRGKEGKRDKDQSTVNVAVLFNKLLTDYVCKLLSCLSILLYQFSANTPPSAHLKHHVSSCDPYAINNTVNTPHYKHMYPC